MDSAGRLLNFSFSTSTPTSEKTPATNQTWSCFNISLLINRWSSSDRTESSRTATKWTFRMRCFDNFLTKTAVCLWCLTNIFYWIPFLVKYSKPACLFLLHLHYICVCVLVGMRWDAEQISHKNIGTWCTQETFKLSWSSFMSQIQMQIWKL